MRRPTLLGVALALVLSASSTAQANLCTTGQHQMSVEGVNSIFCVSGRPCIADYSAGACPAAQDALPFGSYCGVVASGVYGCKPYTSASTNSSATTTDTPVATVAPRPNCTTDTAEMSVQGFSSVFCSALPACAAGLSTGACPTAQPGLPFGSYCARLETGVYGCKPYSGVGQPSTAIYAAPRNCSGNEAGDTPVSVMGATRAYCAASPVCAGSVVGNCPTVQDGLQRDSHCDLISADVYGCVLSLQN